MNRPAGAWIGTSGWSYPNWRRTFYPNELEPRTWLPFYARHFRTVELNASFYRLPAAAVVERWAAMTPPGFRFAVKASRAITHLHRLEGAAEPAAAYLDRVAGFGARLGPVLFQLPPRFPADLARLDAFLAGLPGGPSYAFEFRDPSWWTDAVFDLLAGAGAAFVPFELGALRAPRVVTASFAYVRLHGRGRPYHGSYPEEALGYWARWLGLQLAAGRDVYVYFDNTAESDHAVRNALALEAMVAAGPRTDRAADFLTPS